MAVKKNNEEKTYFNLGEDWEVENVRQLDFGTFFTLKLPGAYLYNIRVVPAGKNYDAFLSMPEDKGKDGNWYKRFTLYLSDDDTAAIIEAVDQALKEAREEKPRKKRK